MQNIGKGLGSLIPPKSEHEAVSFPKVQNPLRLKKESVFNIETNKIRPNPMQPRQEMDREGLEELADSIKEHGILQPLIVTKSVKDLDKGQDVEYTLIAGHRRWAAAKMLGLPHVPAIVRDSTEQQKLELALVENLQRADLNALDKANAFRRLHDEFDLTHQEIAQKVGKSREAVTNTLRLLKLPPSLKQALAEERISEGHARALLSLSTPQSQIAVFEIILKKGLNVRQTEELAAQMMGQRLVEQAKPAPEPEITHLEKRLETTLGTRVRLNRGRKGGTLTIHFYSDEELNALVDRLLGG